MTSKETSVLDKDSRKRLEKLEGEWNKNPIWGEKLTLADLRLLLEHHAPLQALIRCLVAPSVIATSATGEHEVNNPALQEMKTHCQQLAQDLDQCRAKAEKLLNENRALEARCQQLELQQKDAQRAFDACQATLARSSQAVPEVHLLRQDGELAQALGLTDLPTNDTQALIQVVSVLAQRDNLERLWQHLKARCEQHNRAANAAEAGLLDSVLGWYNHNWQSRPYRRIDAPLRGAYDYERHQRSRHVTGGETVTEQRLPGIADGSGKPLCKALVCTQ